METLVVVEQHRNQYCGRMHVKHCYGAGRVGSLTARGLRGISCRSFHSGPGILPTPIKRCPSSVTKRGYSSPLSSPRTPSPLSSADKVKTFAKSAPIAIKSKSLMNNRSFREDLEDENVSFSELWAGPAYSNSPPPSSLPIPKFSMLPKRTVSLELPSSTLDSEIVPPTAKSAPASPTRESGNGRFGAHNFATKDLCRMLNLEIAND